MTRFAALALASLSLLSLSSCFEDTYKVAESEVLLRYLPEKDELLMLEIEHGIGEGARNPDPLRKAADMLEGIAEGKRIFPASGEWMATDLDELLQKVDGMTDQEHTELVTLCDSVHIEDHGLFLEAEGRLSLFRLTRFTRFQRVLDIANATYNRDLCKSGELTREFAPDFPVLDEETWRLWHAAALKDHKWLGAKEGAIMLDMPMTSANAARCLASIARDCPKTENSEALAQLVEQASGLEVTEGHTRLRFGEEPRQRLRFTYHSKSAESSEALIALLRKEGVDLGGSDAPKKALAKLEAPPQIRSK